MRRRNRTAVVGASPGIPRLRRGASSRHQVVAQFICDRHDVMFNNLSPKAQLRPRVRLLGRERV